MLFSFCHCHHLCNWHEGIENLLKTKLLIILETCLTITISTYTLHNDLCTTYNNDLNIEERNVWKRGRQTADISSVADKSTLQLW